MHLSPIALVLAISLAALASSKAVATVPLACKTLSAEAFGNGPTFLVSYPTEKSGALHQTAFLYDNAVAVIGLVACGDLRGASRIGDAMLVALEHDRHWQDGRLRNAYLAGAPEQPVKLPGSWDNARNMWAEDQYQAGSDNGNQAWAMLALLALHRSGAGPQYLKGAARIASHVEKSFDARGIAGFTGGSFGGEPRPKTNRWKSTEHNTDLAAGFAQLAQATKDARWKKRSDQASQFVAAMWSKSCECFGVGTGEDGRTRNPQLALDAQIWPLLAIPGGAQKFSGALRVAQKQFGNKGGYSYSAAKDGIWTEGTAQVALLMKLRGDDKQAADLIKAAQRNHLKDGRYYASDTSGLQTGFRLETDPSQSRTYSRIPHLAALGWVAIAVQGFNPFTATRALP